MWKFQSWLQNGFEKIFIITLVSSFMSLGFCSRGSKPSKRVSITRVWIYCLLMALSSSVLGDFDHLDHLTSAHIQLQDRDEPKKKRRPRLNYNPVGWHNYKIAYETKGKKI